MSLSRQLNQAYEILKQAKLDTPEHRKELETQIHPLQTALAFKILHETNLLYPIHRTAILSHPQPHLLANGLKILNSANLQSLFSQLHGRYPEALATIFVHLSPSKLLTDEIIKRLTADHPNLQNLALAIAQLNQFSILNSKTLALVIKHHQPMRVAQAFTYLARMELFTPKNQVLVLKYLYPEVLSGLYAAGLLNQENLNLVFSPSYAFLFSPSAIEHLWQEWPSELIQTQWLRILEAAQAPLPENALQALTDAVLNPPVTTPSLNSSQSTHTTSIHQSTTHAILELKSIYKHELLSLQDLQIYLDGLAPNPKNEAAQRCLMRLMTLADPNPIHLVCLAFTAIHDDSRRQGSLHDGLSCFVDGLYEIQRGYNLNEDGKDLGGADKPICIAGSFNKIIEKLAGLHPAVELKFITHELANLKFPILVNEEITQYVKSLASPSNLKELAKWHECQEQLSRHGIESIWPKIQDKLISRFLAEFGSLYQGQESVKLQALIDNVPYLKTPDLSQFQAQISQSKGYLYYLSSLALRNHWLWKTKTIPQMANLSDTKKNSP